MSVYDAQSQNTARSTRQYSDLEKLHQAYKDKGLVVIAVPSNDFNQELSSNLKVKEFCNVTFGLTLRMTEVTSIRGKEAHPFYRWLKREHNFQPKWNFYKILINKEGKIEETYSSLTKPTSNKSYSVINIVSTLWCYIR